MTNEKSQCLLQQLLELSNFNGGWAGGKERGGV